MKLTLNEQDDIMDVINSCDPLNEICGDIILLESKHLASRTIYAEKYKLRRTEMSYYD